MLPFNAQGGNQALEDGGALYSLFSNLPSKTLVTERLKLFNQARRKRANRQQIFSSVPTDEVKSIADKLEEYASEGPPDISKDESMRESILREMGYVLKMEDSRIAC
jgi:salicylate hydroxylase